MSLYNLGYSYEDVARILTAKFTADKTNAGSLEVQAQDVQASSPLGFALNPSTIADWTEEFKEHLPYLKMRPYAVQLAKPKDAVIQATLAHQQLYRYRFHTAKCQLIIKSDYANRNFMPLVEFLRMVPAECPHQFYQQGERASESCLAFSKAHMIVRSKQNYATKLAKFCLQGADQRKDRHELLEKFFLYNDSVTVATEVPVYLTKNDLEHFKSKLGFEFDWQTAKRVAKEGIRQKQPCDSQTNLEGRDLAGQPGNQQVDLPNIITGHIDLLQIRNGAVHILDYKPASQKDQPIDQLTLYALALSRLTGLRLFEFKCAWFDENSYFEFFPLHVLYKPKKAKRRRKVGTKEGVYLVNKREDKVESVAPVKSVTKIIEARL